ncbi:hypothetical protein H0H93_013640 [Arthromyces matolae]|nr:hypothetical protein H0H93_013640 [Arthromyces matolae]
MPPRALDETVYMVEHSPERGGKEREGLLVENKYGDGVDLECLAATPGLRLSSRAAPATSILDRFLLTNLLGSRDLFTTNSSSQVSVLKTPGWRLQKLSPACCGASCAQIMVTEDETDKATIDVEAQDDGIMGKILLQDGAKNVPVGKVIALLAQEGDDISNLEAPKEDKPAPKRDIPPPAPAPEVVKSSPESQKPASAQGHSSHATISHSRPIFPSVHRLILEFGITKPDDIKGTGVRGMLTKGDVLSYLGKASGPTSDSEESSSSVGSDSYDSDSDSDESIVSSSSDSFCYASESEVPKLPSQRTYDLQTLVERRKNEETVAAIRLRTRHHDPYEDWERQTRLDAFRTARKEVNVDQKRFHDAQDRGRTADIQRREAEYNKQMKEVEMYFEKLRLKAKQEEDLLLRNMKARQTKIWENIEGVIKVEEEKVRARLAEEARQRDEEARKLEQKRKEEEEARRLKEEKEAAEKKAREEEEKRVEEEKRKKKEQDEEAARLKEAQAQEEIQQKEIRSQLGMTTPEADWKLYNDSVQNMKNTVMKQVKGDSSAKSIWSKARREITPKIYFNIFKFPPNQQPLHPAFQLPRFWAWLTRILKNKQLLALPITPQLIYTALDVMDADGRKLWGHQYNKLLELVYDGVTKGYEPGKLIGGPSPEASSARSRVKLTVERVLLGS